MKPKTSNIKRIVARVLVSTNYKCFCCYKVKIGESYELPFDTTSTEEIQQFVDNIIPNPRDMPVGWASYGFMKYKCNACCD